MSVMPFTERGLGCVSILQQQHNNDSILRLYSFYSSKMIVDMDWLLIVTFIDISVIYA